MTRTPPQPNTGPDRSLEEIDERGLFQFEAPYGVAVVNSENLGAELNYAALLGPGFERLCFHLLLAERRQPRFFGQTGQAQFGIDLIVHDGQNCEVYQCKNVPDYGVESLKRDLEKFRREWLQDRPMLPRPSKFVLCCSATIREREAWVDAKERFVSSTGVRVEEWDRQIIDARLRMLPDIVADLFGDAAAERFCHRDHWNDGRFRPLLNGNGDPDVEAFVELRDNGRLARDLKVAQQFQEIIERERVILIEGSSGTGKTTAALDFASTSGRRVFFVRIEDGLEEEILFRGVRDRCVRDTIFVLDDCQNNWSLIERADRRWRQAISSGSYKLVLTAQTAPEGTESYGLGVIDLVEQVRNDKACIRLEPTAALFRTILALSGSRLATASDQGIERLRGVTANNLAVLNLVMEQSDAIAGGADTIEAIAPEILLTWFGTRFPIAPKLRAFAAIAQFEITIPAVAVWPEPEATAYRKALARLVHRAGYLHDGIGPSWRFSHAAVAETLFRALSTVANDGDWQKLTVRCIAEHLSAASLEPARFARDALAFLRNRLRLIDETKLKAAVLATAEVVEAFRMHRSSASLATLSLATFLARFQEGQTPYASWFVDRLTAIVADPHSASSRDVPLLGNGLRTLGLANPLLQQRFLAETTPQTMLRLIRARGTIFELFAILQYTTTTFAADLIATLDADIVNELISKTIDAQQSIGTLNLTLRELAERPMPTGDERTQLQALQSLIGGAAMLRLIQARGTIFELFRILQYTTATFAADLIGALNAEIVDELIGRSIDLEQSIGTLDLALRELAERPMPAGDERSQLQALEALIGGARILQLIQARGTIFHLFKILENTTATFAASLIGALDADIVDKLIRKTIEAHRSIGTLHLALRELAQRPMPTGDERTQLQALEALIGGAPLLRLILARGTIFELFRILQYTTATFAAGLIGALNADIVDQLINKAIGAKRSIGTLNLTLRELAQRPMPAGNRHTQLQALEVVIGGSPMLRLIRASGTIFELFVTIQYTTAPFAADLIGALDADIVDELIAKTIAAQRSIGSLHFTLRYLRRTTPQSLTRLENLLRPQGFWRLVEGAGDLGCLPNLLESLSPAFVDDVTMVAAAPDALRWRAFMRRGGFRQLAWFTAEALHRLPEPVQATFMQALNEEACTVAAVASWSNLAQGISYAERVIDTSAQTILKLAWSNRLQAAELTTISFEGFLEAANGLSLLWRYRAPIPAQIGLKIWDYIPPEREWPTDCERLIGGRFLLQIASSSAIPDVQADRIVAALVPLPVGLKIEECGTGPLYLFLWNLYGFWETRGRSRTTHFLDLLDPPTWERLIKRLQTAAGQARDDKDRLAVLALAGVLSFCAGIPELRLREAAAGRVTGFPRLLVKADALSFVPAVLASIGLSFIGPPRLVFASDRAAQLVAKSENYEDRGPGIEALCAFIKRSTRSRPRQ